MWKHPGVCRFKFIKSCPQEIGATVVSDRTSERRKNNFKKSSSQKLLGQEICHLCGSISGDLDISST